MSKRATTAIICLLAALVVVLALLVVFLATDARSGSQEVSEPFSIGSVRLTAEEQKAVDSIIDARKRSDSDTVWEIIKEDDKKVFSQSLALEDYSCAEIKQIEGSFKEQVIDKSIELCSATESIFRICGCKEIVVRFSCVDQYSDVFVLCENGKCLFNIWDGWVE